MTDTKPASTYISRFVSHGDATIHYLDCSTGTDADELTPLIFVPGMSCIAHDYTTIATHTGRRTIVIDLRGHGLSSTSQSGYRLDDHASDVASVVDEAVPDHDGAMGDVHVMTFSRGTCYVLRWCELTVRSIRSFTIGDYPGREIPMSQLMADSFLAGTWRGTPVATRVDEAALRATFAESKERPLWHVLTGAAVPVAVVRSAAAHPVTDVDWDRYASVPGIRRVTFDGSPHDIFRQDRGRFGRLARESAELGDRQFER